MQETDRTAAEASAENDPVALQQQGQGRDDDENPVTNAGDREEPGSPEEGQMRTFNMAIAVVNSFLAGALAVLGQTGAAAFVGATAILCAFASQKETKS